LYIQAAIIVIAQRCAGPVFSARFRGTLCAANLGSEARQMANNEEIEKVRQEIMRFNELLHVMRRKLEYAERAYARLFQNCDPEDVKNLKEKDLQWKVAEQLVHDLSPLSIAVVQAQFDAREIERAFEELYNIIVTVPDPDE
jgi:DNA-directed RNA polymerase subunit F